MGLASKPKGAGKTAQGAISKCTGDRAKGWRLEYPHRFECGLTMTQIIVDVDQRELCWWEVSPQHARL